jgi:hypothetical protein
MKFDNTSVDNLKRFVESQKSIQIVEIGQQIELTSDFVPVFKHLLNLNCLVSFTIAAENALQIFREMQICNRHVKTLISRDRSPEEFEKLFKMFPKISRLEFYLFTLCLENDNVLALINSLQHLKELSIVGRFLTAETLLENTDYFLRKLQIKNLEKVQFVKYEFSSPRMSKNIDAFTKNHPGIKIFEVETSDFGLTSIEVIVKNLKQLEKLDIKTPNSTFSWDLEDLKKLRKSQQKK